MARPVSTAREWLGSPDYRQTGDHGRSLGEPKNICKFVADEPRHSCHRFSSHSPLAYVLLVAFQTILLPCLMLRVWAVGNVASAVDSGWMQFSSFVGGGLGVFAHSPQGAARASPAERDDGGNEDSAHAARYFSRSPSSPVGVLRNPLRENRSSPAPHQPGEDNAFGHQNANGSQNSAGGMHSWIGSISTPCVPKQIEPSVVMMTIKETSASPSSIGNCHPTHMYGQMQYQTPREPGSNMQQDDHQRSSLPCLMPPLMGRFRAGQIGGWTVVHDEPSKPKPDHMGVHGSQVNFVFFEILFRRPPLCPRLSWGVSKWARGGFSSDAPQGQGCD